MVVPTTALVVDVAVPVEGNIVKYIIFEDAEKRDPPLKVTRYSELERLNRAIAAEVRNFNCPFPPKTIVHQKRPQFIEMRRSSIQNYLRMCTQNENVKASQTFKNFFPAVPQQVIEITEEPAQNSQDETRKDDSEEEDNLDDSLYGKWQEKVSQKKMSVASAEVKQSEVNQQLEARQSVVKSSETELLSAAAAEREMVVRLRTHQFSLEELQRDLIGKKAPKADSEKHKSAEAKRLKEDLDIAMDTTKAARAKLEAARSKNAQMAAEIKTKQEEAENHVAAAMLNHAVAFEQCSAMKKALSALGQRLEACDAERKTAEIERDGCQAARDSAKKDEEDAIQDLRRYQTLESTQGAALAAHREDSERRARSHEAEARRSKEYAAETAAWRDMRSRAMILGDDRAGFEFSEEQAQKVAEAASEACKDAALVCQESKKADTDKLLLLKSAHEKAVDDVRRRELVVNQLGMRLSSAEAALRDATVRFNTAHAVAAATEDDAEALRKKIDGVLQKTLDDCTSKLDEAKKGLADIKKQQDAELAPFRHAMEAEMVILKQHETQEAKLVQLLDEARTLASEARDDQLEEAPTDGTVNLLVESAKARCADRQAEVKATADAAKDAAAAVVTAGAQLAEEEGKLSAMSGPEEAISFSSFVETPTDETEDSKENKKIREENQKQMAALRQRISGLRASHESLKHVEAEKNAAKQAAVEAGEAAEMELQALLLKQKKEAPPTSILRLVEQELGQVAQCVNIHVDKEQTSIEKSKRISAEWAAEKASLQEELQRANVQVDVAKADLKSFQKIRKDSQSFGNQ